MQILMLSSSKANNSEYLAPCREMIQAHLGNISSCLFIPFAGITMTHDEYTQKVQDALPEYAIKGIHEYADPIQAIVEAKSILVGGGNTFHLLYQLQTQNLISAIQDAVAKQTPYIGWSAGSNICGNSIRTTNDMPIIEPPSFTALGFVPCQLNPHYTDEHPEGFHGETRDERLTEFSVLNPDVPVLGIREGGALIRQGDTLTLAPVNTGIQMLNGKKTIIPAGSDLSYCLVNT
jgi:dipeptidase E